MRRNIWMRQLKPPHPFYQLFDLIPGLYFFAKNRKGEFMLMNRANRQIYHLPDEAAVVGRTDFDVSLPSMARSYVRDDAHIYATGQPLLNHVELWFQAGGTPEWFVVNKMPILSRRGKIIGVMGFLQSYESRAKLLNPSTGIFKAVTHLRCNYAEDISVRKLAQLAGLSARQLERKFLASFGVRPLEFAIKTRLIAACRKLRDTDDDMSDIAFSCGFGDQNILGRHFRRYFGMTPSGFRAWQWKTFPGAANSGTEK
jgi:AraC-like DNA-binding protein